LSEINPPEFRADAVYEVRNEDDRVEYAIIFEVQLAWKSRKLFSWPAYVGILRARFECPVLLVVITMNPRVAAQYAVPINLDGRGLSSIVPLVIGPSEVPIVAEPVLADAMPELAVLSVMAHADNPEAVDIASAALTAAAKLDDERASLYADLIYAYVGPTARKVLEASMGLENYEFQSDFAKRFIAEGRAEGRRSTLLAVLDARGLRPTDAQRQHIEACDDLDLLEQWARAAVNASSIAVLFEQGA